MNTLVSVAFLTLLTGFILLAIKAGIDHVRAVVFETVLHALDAYAAAQKREATVRRG